MRIGVSDTVGPSAEIRKQAERTAEYGYDAFWTQELIDTKDGMTTAAAIAAWDLDLDIVVGLPSPYVRHPTIIATELCSIDDYADGRVTGFATGTSAPEVLEKIDEQLDRPVRTMSETCDILRSLIEDGFCDYDGEVFQLDDWKLRSDFKSDDVPLFLAGMGPKMRELAAYKYDGLFLPFNSPAPFVADVAADLEDHLAEFDRDRDDVTLALNVPTAVTDPDSELSYEEQIRDVVEFTAWHCCSDHIQPLVDRAGVEYDIEALRTAVRENDYGGIRDVVDDEFLDVVSVVGPPEKCRERYHEYLDAGLDYPVIYNYGAEEVKLRNVDALRPEKLAST